MSNRLQLMLCLSYIMSTVSFLEGSRLTTSSQTKTNSCEDWINFKNVKCLKMADVGISVTKEDAVNVCKSYSKDSTDKPLPRLVTIKNEEQQKFLNKLVSKLNCNVWLGLAPNNQTEKLEWNDGSKLVFSNFANSNQTGKIRQCVKMNVNGSGTWERVGCSERNKVVCERDATWALANMQGFLQDTNITGWEGYDYKSEPNCREKMMRTEDHKDLLMKAAEKAMEVLKDATEKIADVEKREKSIREIESSSNDVTDSLCDQWSPYKDEKCVKIFESTGTVRHEDGNKVCKRVSAELLTIKTAEEQEAFQQLLFVKNKMVDNVWLGLKKKENTEQFEWMDESKLSFINWANQTLLDEQDECVEMKASDGLLPAGLWFKVSCKRKNAIICQKRPTWTLKTLQDALLNFRFEQRTKTDLLEKERTVLAQEVKTLKQNPVPVGFIYAQLPLHDPPTALWPMTHWADVSSNYSGLFFRVAGGNAAEFGKTQEETSPRLTQVQSTNTNSYSHDVTIPGDGSWSGYHYDGSSSGTHYGVRYMHSMVEVRPRNQAMKIWKRVK